MGFILGLHRNLANYIISPYNSSELFSTGIVWFIDGKCTHTVTIVENPEEITAPTTANGAVFILNGRTGQFFIRIIHTSYWLEQNQIAELAVWKTIAEVTALIHSLPTHERPNRLLIHRYVMLNPYAQTTNFPDFPNMAVDTNYIYIPFKACVKIEKIRNSILRATGPEMVVFNLYDDWLESIAPANAFARLVVILRAMDFDNDRARVVLKPDETVATEPRHFWPTLTHAQWTDVEMQLQNLLPANYLHFKNVI